MNKVKRFVSEKGILVVLAVMTLIIFNLLLVSQKEATVNEVSRSVDAKVNASVYANKNVLCNILRGVILKKNACPKEEISEDKEIGGILEEILKEDESLGNGNAPSSPG